MAALELRNRGKKSERERERGQRDQRPAVQKDDRGVIYIQSLGEQRGCIACNSSGRTEGERGA